MCLTPQEANEYREYLIKLADSDSKDIISNSGKDHAVVLYSILLNNSKSDVCIYCQSGNSPVWHAPEFIVALNKFLDKENSKLRILTSEEPALSPEITRRGVDKVEVYRIAASEEKKIKDHFKNSKCNFAIFDKKMYRYEYDFEQFKAYCSFNAPEVVNTMRNLFDVSFRISAERNHNAVAPA